MVEWKHLELAWGKTGPSWFELQLMSLDCDFTARPPGCCRYDDLDVIRRSEGLRSKVADAKFGIPPQNMDIYPSDPKDRALYLKQSLVIWEMFSAANSWGVRQFSN